jgi:MoaA/NifB/PqqE/SkfB family radical SAM enzyme
LPANFGYHLASAVIGRATMTAVTPSPAQPDWRWRLRLVRGFATGQRAANGPFSAVFDVTTRCNLHCLGCPRHGPGAAPGAGQDFPWPEFERLLPELRALGTAKLVLIGEGEPFLHPRLIDMVALAKRRGFHVLLVTNGSLLDGRAATALLDAELDELRVSLWASNEAEYAQSCGSNGPQLFGRVLDGLKRLSGLRRARGQSRPRLTLHRPIERGFFRSLPAMVELAGDCGCDALSFSPLKPLGELPRERGLDPDEERELRPMLLAVDAAARARGLTTNVQATLRRYQIGEHVWRTSSCYMAWIDVRIRTDGEIMVCGTCRTPLGNAFVQPLTEIWNGAGYRRFRAAARQATDFAAAGFGCDCAFCCHALTNARMHRWLGWLPQPLGVSHEEPA